MKMLENREIILSAKGLTKVFGFGSTKTLAVDHVDLELYKGEVVSIVGESGSGKTTLAKMLLGLISITEGEIYSYNIFHKIDAVLLDCIRMRGGGRLPKEKKVELMEEACRFVNLKFEELTNKYPFELSGGQMQRLMIARIFLLKPKILFADEPTSMIDACSRATILDMLMQLRNEIGMTVIFITHDIGLAYYVSDKVFIMEHGKFVESGSADEVILSPRDPYTQRLISDVPKIYEEWDLSTVECSTTI
jgi:peptide/nickel transport system ATP-binding protein